MKQSVIRFLPEFEERLCSGRKTATSRTKPLGKPGDVFYVFGQQFEFTLVRPHSLGFVAQARYRQEGFETSEAFIAIWEKIHPRKGYDPKQTIWYHEFKKVS
jgi:hypothetical protein